jgi:hypothetical protein
MDTLTTKATKKKMNNPLALIIIPLLTVGAHLISETLDSVSSNKPTATGNVLW